MEGKKGRYVFAKLIHEIGWIVIMNIHETMSLIYILPYNVSLQYHCIYNSISIVQLHYDK